MQKCETCEYEKVCEIPDFVRNNLKSCKTYNEKKVKTNADKIRSMSDEELAEFLAETELHGSQGSYKDYLEWLKSPTTD